jgi:hypothetical protein
MKKINLILIALLLSSSLHAQKDVYNTNKYTGFYLKQFNHYPERNSYNFSGTQGEKFYKTNHIKSKKEVLYSNANKNQPVYFINEFNEDGKKIAVTRYSTKDKVIRKSEFTYHQLGKINTVKITNGKGQISTQSFEYDKDTNTTLVKYTNYKDQTISSIFEYNTLGKLISREDLDIKGNYLAYKIEYNSDGSLKSKSIFEKDRDNPKKILVYDYYENGDKKTITYYEKGKPSHAWNYDCKPEGELINIKNKDHSTICIKEEHDSTGNRIVWERTFDEKGHLVKKKHTYSQDSTLLSTQYFSNKDNRLYFERKLKKEGGTIEILYNGDGSQQIWSESFYNQNMKLTKVRYLYGKQKTISLYHYDGDLKTSDVNINKHGTSVTEIIYTFY